MNIIVNYGVDFMNKLGLSEDRLLFIEEEIFKLKSNLIDEQITFNTDEYDIEYLKRLHEFLFGDLYFDAGNISKRLKDTDIIEIQNKLSNLRYMIDMDAGDEYIKQAVNELIDIQIFNDGNKRTIGVFLDILMKNKKQYTR